MIFERLGLSVWITNSDESKLPEYQVQETSQHTIECWIASTEGSNFEIHYEVRKNLHPEHYISTLPVLDGVEMSGDVAPKRVFKAAYTASHFRQLTGRSTARLYEFGTRALTDSDGFAEPDESILGNLNTVKLIFEWGHKGSDACAGPDESILGNLNTVKLIFEWGHKGRLSAATFDAPEEVGPIHEKVAKKGHSSAVKLGKTVSVSAVSKGYGFIRDEEIPQVTFVFRYAPQDWLQAEGIILRSTEPGFQEGSCVKKRALSTLDVIDVDELESDDEIQIIKHMVPAPTASNKKQRASKQEDIARPKKEED
ncbi:unnamed protein product [Rhizoctonia solani]|uniref:Uncharacterized protein n=1 Tax=Rhizoctonia solani TaxID=456999 RepID=A0A8H3CRS3_9AGAM|nr:unnamed protein product [Rhizoctonia solani]